MCCLGKVTSTKCTRARTRAVPALRLVVAGVAGDHDDGKGFAHIQEQSGTPSTGRPAFLWPFGLHCWPLQTLPVV